MTGISSGIGESVLELALNDGMRVTGVVRSRQQQEALAKKYQERVEIWQADLADRRQVKNLCQKIAGVEFEYVLLNAGCARTGVFHELAAESVEQILDVNLWANMRVVQALLPRALEVPTKMVLVSSLVAQMNRKDCASYAVSKAGLSKFYQCLRKEYPELPLLCLEIGPVDTPIHAKSSGVETAKNPLIFKSREKIAARVYHAMRDARGLRTLSWDWALMRAIAKWLG